MKDVLRYKTKTGGTIAIVFFSHIFIDFQSHDGAIISVLGTMASSSNVFVDSFNS